MSAQNTYLSPTQIRMFLQDQTAAQNFLLEAQEYTNEELDFATQLTIDKYNTTDPLIDFRGQGNFPFRIELLYGVCAILLRMKANNMIRNRVNYQTQGGTTVDEKKNAEDYLKLAAFFDEEFDRRVRRIKAWININQGFGELASSYSWLNLGSAGNDI